VTVWAVVPTKALAAAKGRLAPALTAEQRQALARAMLADVLAALLAADGLARVLVVSPDEAALALAESLGGTPLREPPLPRGEGVADDALNAALDHAASVATSAGAMALLALPSDVPLVTPADVAALVTGPAPTPAVVLAPTLDGGTGALLRRPPQVVPACFGSASLHAHLRAAGEVRVLARLLWRPNLALDIDRPEHLQRLRGLTVRSRAQALLAKWADNATPLP
jgi:2-phospho-L-lactate/phosphoenolpyruvate guanylyltransferase